MEARGRREDLDGNITIIRHYGSSLILKRIARMRHASLSIHYASSFLVAPNESGMKEKNALSMLSFQCQSLFILLFELLKYKYSISRALLLVYYFIT